jgi:putative transposase
MKPVVRELAVGLLIRRGGLGLELFRRTNRALYFERPETGDIFSIEEKTFYEELRNGHITLVEGLVTPDELPPEILHPTDAGPAPPARRTVARVDDLSLKQQSVFFERLDYMLAAREAKCTTGDPAAMARVMERVRHAKGYQPRGVKTILAIYKTWTRSNYDDSTLVSGHSTKIRRRKLDDANDDGTQLSHSHLVNMLLKQYMTPCGGSVSGLYAQYRSDLVKLNQQRTERWLRPLHHVCLRTFYRAVAELPKYDVAAGRFGVDYANKQFRLVVGRARPVALLETAEIDHTKLPIYVVDDVNLLPLGKPTLTVVREQASKCILGMWLTFDAPKFQSALLCIKHSLTPHSDIQSIWPDIEHQWETFGVAGHYVSDNAAEFRGHRWQELMRCLNHAGYSFNMRRTPWHKASVERFFADYRGLFERVPGVTLDWLLVDYQYNPKKDAVIRFSSLCYLLYKWICDHYHRIPQSRTRMAPIETWMQLSANLDVRQFADPVNLDTCFGTKVKRQLSHEGIRANRLTYGSPELRSLRREIGVGQDVEVLIHEDNVAYVDVRHPRTGTYFMVPCTRPEYATGLTLLHHKNLCRAADARVNEVASLDQIANMRSVINDRVAADLQARNSLAKVKIARGAGIDLDKVLRGEPATTSRSQVECTAGSPLGPDFSNIKTFRWT